MYSDFHISNFSLHFCEQQNSAPTMPNSVLSSVCLAQRQNRVQQLEKKFRNSKFSFHHATVLRAVRTVRNAQSCFKLTARIFENSSGSRLPSLNFKRFRISAVLRLVPSAVTNFLVVNKAKCFSTQDLPSACSL